MKRLLLPLLLCLAFLPALVKAQNTDLAPTPASRDSVVVSLLTCTPGNMVHELYGHTAIRVREINTDRPSDWVFNYGTFTFNQPHFIWRFVMGEVDYELSVLPYIYFYESYLREQRGVEEQILNLTPDEERQIVNALSTNLRPENAKYRYNFFYDNCTTRAINIIAKHLDGKIDWKEKPQDERETIRDIVHRFSHNSPWYMFGQDLLLGADADRPATREVRQFSPVIAMQMAEKAVLESKDGSRKPFVAFSLTLLPNQLKADKSFPLAPFTFFGILLAFTLILSVLEVWRKKYYWGYDALLLLAQGLTGCIITFLYLFSPHPTVDSNYLIVLFNPFPLLYFPWLMKHASLGQRSQGMYVQAGLLILTLLFMWLGPQEFPVEIYFIVGILSARFVVHILRTAPKHIENH